MIKVAVFCCAGMSTSMLVKKIEDCAKSKGIDLEIDAYSETELSKHTDVDAVLLGPQISYMIDKANSIYNPYQIPVEVINTVDYGMMNGASVLETILKITNKK